MGRAERRHHAKRKAAKVRRWAKAKCPWLDDGEVARRVDTTIGSGRSRRYFGNQVAEAEAALAHKEQLAELD